MAETTHQKQDIVDGIEYSYSSDWIYTLETEEHWRLYWRQARLLRGDIKPGERVLEIGVGTGFLANYLKSQKINVITMDIDVEKGPDIVANVVSFDWSQKEFDHILGFEVFEHIPFEKLNTLFSAMTSSCRRSIAMSIPVNEYVLCRTDFRLPLIGRKKFSITVPKFHIDEPHHFWEIGPRLISKKQICEIFKQNNFILQQYDQAFSRLYLKFKRAGS